METPGVCPQCGSGIERVQVGAAIFLRCENGHQMPAPMTSTLGDWSNLASAVNQSGIPAAYDMNLTPEHRQAIIDQVRATQGEAMAAHVSRSLGGSASGGQIAYGLPAASMPDASSMQGKLMRALLLTAILTVLPCLLMVGVCVLSAGMQATGTEVNVASLLSPLNGVLAPAGIGPAGVWIVPLLAAAVGLLAIAGVGSVRAWTARSWPTTDGVIFDSSVYHRRRGSEITTRVNIEYRYEVGGLVYQGTQVAFGMRGASTFEFLARRIVSRYPKGGMVRVHYDPQHPERAVLETRYEPAMKLVIAAVIGIAVVVVSVVFPIFPG